MQHKSIEILGYIINVLTIAIYFAMLFFLEIPPAPIALQIVGWILFIAGIALILLTVLTLRKKHTESVIWSGVFSVVRHPLYLGSIFLFLAMPCFLPYWIMFILAVVNAIYIYWSMLNEEQKNIKKFGDEYERYLQSVPRVNLFAGFIRLLRSKQR
jgi:protein-S-isoprenylcysteine O-methyltransferase Ste14